MEELVVDLNRSGVNTVEPRREAVVATGGLRLRLQAHDRPARVHLRLAGAWSQSVSLPDTNILVTPEAERVIELTPAAEECPTTGQVVVGAGYGATTEPIDVEVTPAETRDEQATTDSAPASVGEPVVTAAGGREELAVAGVLVVAVGTAVGGVAVVGPQLPVLIGAGVVIVTAVVGVFHLYVE